MKISPTAGKILCEQITGEAVSAGGIIMPDVRSKNDQTYKYKVLKVGKERKKLTTNVKEGDVISVKQWSAFKFDDGLRHMAIVRFGDVLMSERANDAEEPKNKVELPDGAMLRELPVPILS